MASIPLGHDTLAAALAAETYPTDVGGLYYAVGDLIVEDGSGAARPVRDALPEVGRQSFDSALEAMNAVRAALGFGAMEPAELEQLATYRAAGTPAGDHQAAISGLDQMIDAMERNP